MKAFLNSLVSLEIFLLFQIHLVL